MPRFRPHTAVRRSQPKVDPASSEARGRPSPSTDSAVGLVLGEEGLPAGQAHHPEAPPLGGQQVGGGQGQRHLGPGGDQHRVGAVAQHVAAAVHPAFLAGAVEHRQVLAGQDQGGGAVGAVQRQFPGLGGLPGVGGAHHPEVGDGPQGGEVLDGLMGGAVLAQQHRVVGEHEDARRLHERRQAQRRAQVVAEHQEGGAVGAQAPVDRQPVDHGPHGELPHPEAEVAPRRGGRLEVGRPGDQRVVGGGQVGRAADEAGQPGGQGVDHLAGGGAGGDRLAHLEALHRPHFHPPRRPVLLPAGGGLRVGGEAAVAALLPGPPGGRPPGHALAEEGVDRRVHFEAALHRPAHRLLGPGDLLLAQGRAVGVGGVLLGRRPVGDVGAAGDQRGPGLVGQGGAETAAATAARSWPSAARVCQPKAAKRAATSSVKARLGRALDGDPVVVVEHDEAAQAQVPGQRGRLRRDALHQAAVPDEDEGAVIHQVGPEHGPQVRLGGGQAHGGGQALAQGAGGGLDAEGGVALRDGPGSATPTGGSSPGRPRVSGKPVRWSRL